MNVFFIDFVLYFLLLEGGWVGGLLPEDQGIEEANDSKGGDPQKDHADGGLAGFDGGEPFVPGWVGGWLNDEPF